MFAERFMAWFALNLYLPFSHFSRTIRDGRPSKKRLRKPTNLPVVGWRDVLPVDRPSVVESEKRSGNVRLSELAILALAAKQCPSGSTLFEIGTFDGRTSLNLAWNAPADARIFTMDLPAAADPSLEIEQGENYLATHRIEPGARFRDARFAGSDTVRKITQLRCDSADFKVGELAGKCALVFVDGSHSHEYATSDTQLALDLLATGGMIIWHDYGVWPGVASALEAFEKERRLGLKHIRGTSLVFWKHDPAMGAVPLSE